MFGHVGKVVFIQLFYTACMGVRVILFPPVSYSRISVNPLHVKYTWQGLDTYQSTKHWLTNYQRTLSIYCFKKLKPI